MIYTGLPHPSQMPPQQMVLPPTSREMVIDVLGVRVPAEMLHSEAFWALLIVAAVTGPAGAFEQKPTVSLGKKT